VRRRQAQLSSCSRSTTESSIATTSGPREFSHEEHHKLLRT
jgi:hypothetical protein